MDIVAVVLNVLSLIEQFVLPNLKNTQTITTVINILEQAIPVAVQEGEALVTPIKNIIAALRASGPVTPDQIDQLDAAEAKLDADFDAASAADAPQGS